MTTRTVVLALVAVVLLSGCFGGSGGTPTAEPSPTPTPLQPAPGVGAETLENVTGLVESHRDVLVEEGFVVEFREGNQTVTSTYATDGSRLIERGDGSSVIWGNESVAVERTTENGDVTYQRLPPDSLTADDLISISRLRERLTSARYERDGTTPCGDTTCVVLTAEGSIGGNLQNFSAEVHVDRRGVIHMLDAEWVRTMDDRQFEFQFTLEELGTSPVDRPDWVGEALDRTE
jgi:hypothetical protein